MQTLTGKTILVTRPAHQADPLCLLIKQAGGNALRFPTLAITDPDNLNLIKPRLQQLAQHHILIFTSANAVKKGLHHINLHTQWPNHCKIAAIGTATADLLQRAGHPASIMPVGPYNSETLLEHPELQHVAGQSILIIRGQQGREHLTDVLRARGATVDYLEVYQRIKPDTAPDKLIQALQTGQLTASTATSPEGLQNLMTMIDLHWHQLLTQKPIIVVSQKMVSQAKQYGFGTNIFLSANATDQSIMATIIHACQQPWNDEARPKEIKEP